MKKIGKHMLAIALVIAMMFGTVQTFLPQQVNAEESDFVIENGVLTKYNGTDTEVIIPEGVTEIGGGAFYENTSITKVVIPDGVTTIGRSAFYSCSNLEDIEIPSTVTSIGEFAFGVGPFTPNPEAPEYRPNTKWLEDKMEENPLVIVNNVLIEGKGAEGVVEVPEGVSVLANYAFEGGKATQVILPDSLRTIGAVNFAGMESLTEITIPEGVKRIESSMFTGCDNLKKVVLPESLTYISFEVFSSCESLEEVWVPSGVTYIADTAFCYMCPNVTIYCEEGSYVHDYVLNHEQSVGLFGTKAPFKYSLIEQPEKEETEVVTLTDTTTISKEDMVNLVELNQTRDVVIESNDGVKFTFPMGKMEITEEKDVYDFGVTLSNEYSDIEKENGIAEDNFVFRINYNYDGKLPGTAKVSIPVNKLFIGAGIDYYLIQEDKSLEWMQTAEVDNNGYFTISMDHCSDYVLKSLKEKSSLMPKYTDEQGLVYTVDTENKNCYVSGKSDEFGAEQIVIPATITYENESYAVEGINNCRIYNSFYDDDAETSKPIKSIQIAEGVQYIRGVVFAGNHGFSQHVSVTIPSTVTEIEGKAFSGQFKVTVASENANYCSDEIGCIYSKDKKKLVHVPIVEGEFTVPSGVVEIGEYAFAQNLKMSSVVIPENVTTIGEYAFESCGYSLESDFVIWGTAGTVAESYAKENDIIFKTVNTSTNTGDNSNQSANNTNVNSSSGSTPTNVTENSVQSENTVVSVAKAKLKAVKVLKGKKLKITWKKDKNASGYQLQLATNKKFTKNKKTVNVNKGKVTSKTVKKLKKGKKYFVRIRAYKNVNGKKVYGKWSAVKKSKKVK